jgi:hypothetical protein
VLAGRLRDHRSRQLNEPLEELVAGVGVVAQLSSTRAMSRSCLQPCLYLIVSMRRASGNSRHRFIRTDLRGAASFWKT